MTRLQELIQDLCPKGVPYKKLGDIVIIKNGKDYKHLGSGNIPVYGTGGILCYVDAFSYNKESVLIPRKGSLNKIYYVNTPFWTVDTIFYTEISTKINAKFFYHYLRNLHLENLNQAGGVPSLTQAVLNELKIAVPPLEVQAEIVRILDKFTQLEAELEAELQLRKKQYEYYRNQLLTFPAGGAQWLPLGNISVKVTSGATPTAGKPEYYENGNIPWLRTQQVTFNEIWNTDVFITEAAVRNTATKWIPENCVIVAISGATAGRSGINKIPLTTNQHCCNFQIDANIANYKYVFYWVASQYEQIKALGQGARSDLNAQIIKNVLVPVPSLAEQERIVSILDKFDALVNDLSIGLPAELAARRKQYEYYRNRLLAFPQIKPQQADLEQK